MNSIQWHYQPTPEEIKKASLVPKLLSFAYHFSGVIYFFIYYFENRDTTFGIILTIVYIAGLLQWHLFLKKTMKLRSITFELNEESIGANLVDANKSYRYSWDEIKSFSKNKLKYQEARADFIVGPAGDERKYIYLKKAKNGKVDLIIPNNKYEEVYEALKNRLEEIL